MKTEIYNLVATGIGIVTLCLWIVTLIAGIATVIVYYKQLRTMQQSIKEQNLAWLIQYLQSAEVREAREFVLANLKTSHKRWDDKTKWIASTACAAYGVAGVYIRTNRIDPDAILDNWGPSIEEVYKVCENFIAERRKANGLRYWEALVEINELAKKANEKNRREVRTITPALEATHAADKVDDQGG